jgi:hypothetical protein
MPIIPASDNPKSSSPPSLEKRTRATHYGTTLRATQPAAQKKDAGSVDTLSEDKEWIQRYVACWNCYQPQDVCQAADPEHEEVECQFPDMVMPLCYGVYNRPGGADWLRKHFGRTFQTQLEYMLWPGESASLGGSRSECIQGNCVAAVALGEFG